MKISMPMLTVVSTVATALPTTAGPPPPNDGRAATIFKGQHSQGDSAAIPANNWCTDLNNIFGNFNNNVRSMIVEKGFKCGFFVNSQCPVSGIKYEFGSKDQALAVGELPEWLDMRIKSVYCSQA